MKSLKLLITNIVVLICLFSAIQLFAEDDWTNQEPVDPPDARRDHAMCSISEGKVLLFGGYTSGTFYGDTWLYEVNENTWTLQNPTTSPSPRQLSAIAYAGDDKVMLYSGEDSDYTEYTDTWIYDLSDNNWMEITTDTTPLPLSMHEMAYIGENKVLLFGGQYTNEETWIFNSIDNTWSQISTNPHPSGRWYHGMSYIGDNKVLLFGGNAGGTDVNDTWLFALNDYSWTEMNPDNSPSIRALPGISYLGGDKVVLFGGTAWPSNFNDTWIYDLSENNWIQDENTINPEARMRHKFCESGFSGTSYPVLFGGLISDEVNDTWTFGGGDYLETDDEVIHTSSRIHLGQNYPNPFRFQTIISYDIAHQNKKHAEILIYNSKGQKVNRFSINDSQSSIEWSGLDWNNRPLSSGVYLYKLKVGNEVLTRKMMLIR